MIIGAGKEERQSLNRVSEDQQVNHVSRMEADEILNSLCKGVEMQERMDIRRINDNIIRLDDKGGIRKIYCEEPICFINEEPLKACDLLNVLEK